MHRSDMKGILEDVRRGRLTVEKALRELKHLPFTDLGFAKLDHHRHLRTGMPEVILCEGKTTAQVIRIIRDFQERRVLRAGVTLATRVPKDMATALRAKFPKAAFTSDGRTMTLGNPRAVAGVRPIAIVTAGTSDIPVAEEARATVEAFGHPVRVLHDVGVAGIHRLLANLPLLSEVGVAVVVAGMEGALPSVVGGLVECPVVAVPTSVGYGASFGGIAALLGMLNSCSAGITVVNIDNGFGAASAAVRMNALSGSRRDGSGKAKTGRRETKSGM